MRPTKVLAEVVLQAEDGEILLVRRSNDDSRRPGQWDVPGGHVDEDEDFTIAAMRELQEETGITLKREALNLAYTITMTREEFNLCWLFYIARAAKQKPILSDEHDDAAWMPLEQAIESLDYFLQKDALVYIRDNRLLT